MNPTLTTCTRYLVLALAMTLSGCMVGPDYKTPAITPAAQWQAPLPHGGKEASLLTWWQQFQDPALNTLLHKAEADSPSLDQAVARITQARATLDSSDAELWPSLTGKADYTRSRSNQQGTINVTNTRTGALDAAWELDLFGKQRRAGEAAQARLQARVDDWYDARTSLAAEVADNYVQYRACQLLVDAYRQQADSLSLIHI